MLTRFSFDLPGVLVFTPSDTVSKFDLEVIKINTLSKSHDNYCKNMTSRVLTRFYFDLA